MNTAATCSTQVSPMQKLQIQIPTGLLGFEQVKGYLLMAPPQDAPFLWLQMTSDPFHSFLAVSPFVVLPDYQPDIASEDIESLGMESPEDALLLSIVTLREKGMASINLKGPIVINRHSLIAKQVIPVNAATYSSQHPLPIAS